MKKTCLIMVLIVQALCMLTGCSGVANEKDIQKNLESYTESRILSENEKISKIVVDKRETKKEEKRDTVWCTITTEDSSVSYQKEAILTYGLTDKDGWVLEDVSVNDSDEWIKTPIKEVTEKDIPNSLDGETITIDGEKWEIEADEVTEISIDKQDTVLEKKTDTLTATLTLSAEVEEAKGKLEINYNFEDGWEVESVSVKKDFTASVKPDVALNINEDDLIAEIVKQEIEFGKPDTGDGIPFFNTSDLQSITMDKNEISDFKIESQTSSSKGSNQTFNCSCTLTKPHAVFNIKADVLYYFAGSNGWSVQPITLTTEISSVNIEGDWTGTYKGAPYSGDSTLSISKVDADGTVTAVYSYSPSNTDKYSQPGSYNVSGKIDMSTLHIELTAGSWVNEPEKTLSTSKSDISAILYVDDSTIQGLGQEGNVFTVKQ